MGAGDQWDDAYQIAEKLYNNNAPVKRTDLNVLEQIVCSRYKTIFSYDPFSDEYKFINQPLKYNQPVGSKCRNVTEADLDVLKKSTVSSQLKAPVYINITPICVVPPSTVLVFNHSQPVAPGLTEALANATTSLTVNPCETEITPGAEFVFKHKNGKCYRCIIISEVGDEEVPEAERRYEVAFLDHCQIVPVKLKTLFIPSDLTLENYPSALQCVRLLGIATFRAGFVEHYNNDIRTFYNDRNKRKTGIAALLYKISKREQKLIVDFPSIHGNQFTNTEEVKMQHGHQTSAENDPIAFKYPQIVGLEIHPLEYIDDEDLSEAEKEKEAVNNEDDDDVELDLSDTDPDSTTLPLPKDLSEMDNLENLLPSKGIVVAKEDCPYGRSSIEKYMLQQGQVPTRVFTKTSVDSSNEVEQSQPNQTSNNIEEAFYLNSTCNESISSLRSATINQTGSSIPTPQPTFDEPLKEEVTPKKQPPKLDGSDDGWGVDTPKKRDASAPSSAKKLESEERHKPLEEYFTSASVPVAPVKQSTPAPSPLSIQRPLTPTPQIEHQVEKPSVAPLMKMNIATPEMFKSFGGTTAVSKEHVYDNNGGIVDDNQDLPSIASIIKTDNRTQAFGSQPPTVNKERAPNPFPPPSGGASETASTVVKTAAKTRPSSDFEDSVFNLTNQGENFQTVIYHPDNSNVCQDANISKASTNQRLIHNAQENFHDIDDDGWENPVPETRNLGKITEPINIFKNEIPIVPLNGVTTSVGSVDENFSRKSVCSGDFGERNSPDLECGAHSSSIANLDESREVSDTLKDLATSFIESIRAAAIQKNHQVYLVEILGLETVSQKMSNDRDKRFMRGKLAEAKSLDAVFD